MKRLAITLGEPAGIGPDIIAQIAQQSYAAELVVFGDANCLLQRAAQLKLPLTLLPFNKDHIQPQQPAQLSIVDIPLNETAVAGTLNVNNSAAVMKSLDVAIDACLDNTCAALVTAPLHKAILAQAGFDFSGHTEHLAKRCQVDGVTMFFVSDALNVSLQTTHVSLQNVASAIEKQNIIARLKQVHDFYCHYLSTQPPRIAVCGLNPHAGEDGLLGAEEINDIIPAVNNCQQLGLNVQGPFAADSLFAPSQRQHFDIIHAMYHDQGLTPFKALNFAQGVNMTCGLPFLRTSVDHGTALSIAGSGRAECTNLDTVLTKTLAIFA